MFENDDLMLNISTHRNQNTPKTNEKSKKKEKYTMKFKKDKSRNPRQAQKFDYNLLPSENQPPKVQKNQNEANSTSKEKQPQHKGGKRNKFFQKEDKSSSLGKHLRPGKKVKTENSENKNIKFQSINIASVPINTPQQIRLQKVQQENKIDTNPLEQFKLNQLLLDSLVKNGITKFTQIQINCYSSIFSGRDVIAKASTGSGKTLAYVVPLINQYLQKKIVTNRDNGVAMLIICPSRQLCLQGQKEVLRCLRRAPFIVPGCLIGGEQTNHQKNRLRRGINILFTTPGRLIYHLKNTKSFKLQNLKTIVFEEADRTLDMGFQKNINQILQAVQSKLQGAYIQKILVSAHFNDKVENLIQNLHMDNPKYIGFEKNAEKQINFDTEQINISKNLKQKYVLMTEQQRIPLIISYLRLVKDEKVMIFVNTIDEVEYLDFLLNNMKYRDSNGSFTDEKIENRQVYKIHGDLDQKYRTNTYFQFRKQKSAVLISTEVASRGLDFPDLNHIILFDVPPTLTDYGNRVGRSARFNSSGVSLLMLHYQESNYAEKIRYYCPTLELLEKQIIFEGFQTYMKKLNIHDKGLYYIEGIVRSLIKDDDEKYQLARKAYVSMLRAYAKLRDKQTFAVKKLDLKLLGRCFGINSTGGKQRTYNAKAKQSHHESEKKRRRVSNVKQLQISQYL